MADPTAEQLQARLGRLAGAAEPFAGVVYRSTTPKYATETDLLTGEGGRRYGGRWNPVGLAVVYASLTPETAMAETLAHNRYYGLPPEDAMPQTFMAFAVDLRTVLDLRRGDIRSRLRVSAAAMTEIDWRMEMRAGREPVTQLLARAAHAGRWEGLVVPSAADPGGHNLLLFPDKLGPHSSARVLGADKLGR